MPFLTGAEGPLTFQTVWEYLASGGPVMIPIGVCSVVALAYALERYVRLTRRSVFPKRVEEALALVERGDVNGALDLCAATDAPAARILAAGLRRKGFSLSEIEGAMEDQGHKEGERLRSNIRPVNLVVGLAPMLGLFGTVIGINEAFHVVVKVGMGKPELLAAGIEVALITTVGGLMVAIPAMVVAAHLSGKVRRLLLAIDEKISPVVERIAQTAEVRHAS